jgi:hypothetical protein
VVLGENFAADGLAGFRPENLKSFSLINERESII